MLPFTVSLQSNQPVSEQVLYAVHKAIVTGQLRVGDPFPSVRALSKELRINPNTAHKIVAALKADGLLTVQPGRGTFVAERSAQTAGPEATALLGPHLEALTVEAKRLGLDLKDVRDALESHWKTLGKKK